MSAIALSSRACIEVMEDWRIERGVMVMGVLLCGQFTRGVCERELAIWILPIPELALKALPRYLRVVDSKTCATCGEVKLLSEYFFRDRARTRPQFQCKVCT